MIAQVLTRQRSGMEPLRQPGVFSPCTQAPAPASSVWAGLPGSPACLLLQLLPQPQGGATVLERGRMVP